MSPGAERLDACCTARSSMSARTTSAVEKPLLERDLVSDRLAIDIGIVAAVTHAQQPVLANLDEPLGRGVETDHQRFFQGLQLMRHGDALTQRNVGGADA